MHTYQTTPVKAITRGRGERGSLGSEESPRQKKTPPVPTPRSASIIRGISTNKHLWPSRIRLHCIRPLFIIIAGTTISLDYEAVQAKVGAVGIHVAVGGIGRGKTNCAQICLAATGNYPSGCHVYMTESAARGYMGNAVPFIYDDPSNLEVLKPILMNSFGGCKISTKTKEVRARCAPLVTANESILDDLAKVDER